MNGKKNGMEKISDEQLESVVGGITNIYNPAGINDIKYSCSKCGFSIEINTKNKWKNNTYINKWECPQCKTKNTSIFEFRNRSGIWNYVDGKTYSQDELTNLDL